MIGAVLYGDTTGGGWYFDLIKNKTDILSIRDWLVYGPGFADPDALTDDVEADLPTNSPVLSTLMDGVTTRITAS